MSEFKREERYVVIKLKDLDLASALALRGFLCRNNIPTRECVVVEPDWPIYEIVWHLVERLATGQRLPFMTDEDPEALQAELARSDNRAQRQRQLEAQLQGEINELECKVLELEAERDALAAHVRSTQRVAETIRGYTMPHNGRCLAMIMDAVEDAPTTSLARRDAEKPTEAGGRDAY